MENTSIRCQILFSKWRVKRGSYLVQLEGFVNKGQGHLLCWLNKALYGLKWAPRLWYVNIDSIFHQKGFVKSKSDHNQYVKKDER